jgi:hypothetical protein
MAWSFAARMEKKTVTIGEKLWDSKKR